MLPTLAARQAFVSALIAVAVGVCYLLAARLGLALLERPDGVAVFWPAAGLASGILIAAGPALRWPIVIGVMTATIAANLLGDRNACELHSLRRQQRRRSPAGRGPDRTILQLVIRVK